MPPLCDRGSLTISLLWRSLRALLNPPSEALLCRPRSRMPLRLPGDTEGAAAGLSHQDVLALKNATSPSWAGPSFGDLWEQVLSRRPVLKQESEALPARPLASIAGPEPVRFLYVMQREWAVVPPPSHGGPDYIASDDATTCHIIAAFNRTTGVCGLCHLDDSKRLGDLQAFEQALLTPLSASSHPTPSPPVDLYIMGGYKDSSAEELTGAVLDYFLTRSHVSYTLRLATVSLTNTLSTPTGPSPRCRAFGLRLSDGAPFTGPLPGHLRGPARALRAARVFADSPQPMTQLHYDTSTHRVSVAPFPFSRASWQRGLLSMDDASLLQHTSTSPTVEGPSFVAEMRQTLALMYDTAVHQHFPPAAAANGRRVLSYASFAVPLVSLQGGMLQGGSGRELGEMKGEAAGPSAAADEQRKRLRREEDRWERDEAETADRP